MEEFELARSDEERKDRYQSVIDYFAKHGTEEDWRLGELIKEEPSDFGLNNPMPEINSYQQKVLDDKFATRRELINKYKALSDTFKFLLDKEAEIWNRLQEVSHEICDIEGHRLSSESHQVFVNNGKEVKASYWVRKCVVCGKEITESTMSYRDCVVKDTEGLTRVLSK